MNKALFFSAFLYGCSSFAYAVDFDVTVESAQKPVAGSEITVWKATPNQKPSAMAESRSSSVGKATFRSLPDLSTGFYYITAKGGEIEGEQVSSYKALTALNNNQSGQVVINEITTIGSVWPLAAQMSESGAITGSQTGLLLGASHVQNLADAKTGSYGVTVLDGSNLTFSETVSRMNTLATLMASCGSYQLPTACQEFLKLSGADNTLTALRNIAVAPYKKPAALFELFTTSFEYPKGKGVRPTQFLPYLEWEPTDFSLMVRVTGGGLYSAGRMMFDNQGQLWSGQNWVPGDQANLEKAVGGGVSRLDASGKAISPPLTGYNRQGLDGIGWGTTVTKDKVWVSSFNTKIGVLDLQGNALGPAKVAGKNGALQGFATTKGGDVWVADNQMNQMLYFPEGDHKNGQVIQVPGLKRPFAVAIDNKDNVWVTNNGFVTVTMFPASTPEKAQQIPLGGMAPRGLAIDSSGHVWVGNNFSMGYPLAKVPPGANIIEEFKLNIEQIVANEKNGINITGNLALISPDGKVIKKGVLEGEIYAAWGVSIDGKDNVFASNFLGTGFAHVCGVDETGCPAGKTTGDLIHMYQSGVLQKATDTMIDDAGNVWMANNWEYVPALLDKDPDRRMATRGGGTGVAVVYGIASPVLNPLIGQVRRP